MTVTSQSERGLLAAAGRVGELREVWPPLVVHAVHPVLVVCGQETALVIGHLSLTTPGLVYTVLTSNNIKTNRHNSSQKVVCISKTCYNYTYFKIIAFSNT